MMDREKPDGVVVSVPNEMHEAVGLECAGRGIHVFMEKPLTTTLRVGRPPDRGRAEAQGEARLRAPPPAQPEDQRRARRDPLGRAGQPRGRERCSGACTSRPSTSWRGNGAGARAAARS
ncbi:MAG: Gfo/Idh/MocA family oxidoreductase [Marinilabiliales bacterium]|nr:Gfo/Idh/MocA family oxidoreductase [Marinilabiliales bacterium]